MGGRPGRRRCLQMSRQINVTGATDICFRRYIVYHSDQVKELLRSSEKYVVLSGAGISANAGCELNIF
jgi:hypothetical protein